MGDGNIMSTINIEGWTLEDLLRMQVEGFSPVNECKVMHSPEFRVAIQRITPEGVHFIIHANGHNSNTLDLLAQGNQLLEIGKDVKYDWKHDRYVHI